MIRWFLRGVGHRRLTSRYPDRPEPAPQGFRARVRVDPSAVDPARARRLAAVCLPEALSLDEHDRLQFDAGRCIGCGLCVDADRDGAVTIDPGYELASRSRSRLVVDHAPREADIAQHPLSGVFRRSLHIRHVDGGSDGAVEQELAALLNPYYDMHRLGLFFTASPRHADVLLVTGPVTEPMQEPLRRTYEAMPEPRVVVAAGTDACSGGIWSDRGVDRLLGVDVYIPGDPPTPIALLHGLLLASGRAQDAATPRLSAEEVS
jgi:Ni,Fe-hydrogenase III small subunit